MYYLVIMTLLHAKNYKLKVTIHSHICYSMVMCCEITVNHGVILDENRYLPITTA